MISLINARLAITVVHTTVVLVHSKNVLVTMADKETKLTIISRTKVLETFVIPMQHCST
jgi:hypothetical protein